MRRRYFTPALLVGLVCVAPARSEAQALTQRGFAEARLALYPQDAPNDRVNGVADLLLREEVFVKPAPWIQFAAGLDLRLNTHDQVQGSWRVDIGDRGRLRPAVSVRRLAGTFARGPITIDVGKQFIRWGKTDIVTPTDRFAPRDFLNVLDGDFLAVSGARGVLQLGAHAVDVVWVPFFTPSRVPLLNQRWAPVPADPRVISLNEIGAVIPDGSQAGVRYSRTAARFEYSLSVFDGFNHLPNVKVVPGLRSGRFDLVRRYPSMRSFGGDVAMPTRWFTVKSEAAYSTSSEPGTDDFLLYVIQLERQSGEWQFIGGYAGEAVTNRRGGATFAPDRGLTRAIVARAAYTIDPNRSVAFEGAARQNGDGVYSKLEYSQAAGQHWRATAGAVLIGGRSGDFLGQYNRNSHVALGLRYSF
jgi:hypothetical protein